MDNRHESTFAIFCPHISTHPNIDYKDFYSRAVATYTGAKTPEQALLFAGAHNEMRARNAIKYYSDEAHRRDAEIYAAGWVDRWIDERSALEASTGDLASSRDMLSKYGSW